MTRRLALLLLFNCLIAHAEDPDLTGLWQATRIFGPALRGPVYVQHSGRQWSAEIGGYRVEGKASRQRLSFNFGPSQGELRLTTGRPLEGHWIQPGGQADSARYASPVHFESIGEGAWRGRFVPLTDSFTAYLPVSRDSSGNLTAWLRNPDRNVGIFMQVSRLAMNGDRIEVYGRFRGRGKEQQYFTGRYDADDDRLSLFVPFLGATLDFHRAGDDSHFFARGRHRPPWRYESPPPTGDGWPTGTLDKAGIDLAPLARMIEQEVEPPPGGLHAHDLHAVLIARHGKLVFEEYFHGFDRDTPHDTRSASKSATATLFGAAIQAGMPVDVHDRIFEIVPADELPSIIDPRSRSMTVEHLLTQSSGFYCDDNDPNAPGNEDTMQEQQDEPDWYRYTLGVPMAAEPGSTAVYCSANSNLLGLVLAARTGLSLEVLFQRLIAEPLGITEYHMNLQPSGEPYMGGGMRWLPRDFMKLGQLYLDGGTWHGQRVLSADWVKRATTARVKIGDRGYGYLWWVQEYPYGESKVAVFYAGGNGGQVVAVVPALDLVVAFYGGNYSDKVLYRSQNVLFPQYILAAVRDSR